MNNSTKPTKPPSPSAKKPTPRFSVLGYALRDLIHRKKFATLFVISLSIGLFSFLIISSIRVSFNSYVTNNSKLIAGGDLVIRSRRAMTPAELQVLSDRYSDDHIASQTTFYSMANNTRLSNNLRLIRVSLISETFPLYDELWVKDFNSNRVDWETARADMENNPVLAITKELMSFFEIAAGDKIKIGNKPYTVKYIVEKDVGNRLQISALAYKVYIAMNQREQGVLTEKGATVRYRHYIRTPELDDNDFPDEIATINTALSALALEETQPEQSEQLQELQDTNNNDATSEEANNLQIRSHNQNTSNIQRTNNTVNRYFELITLVTLFLSGIGVFYLFRSFVFSKIKEIAVLESLGMGKAHTIFTMIAQLIVLGLASVGVSLILFVLFRPLIDVLFGDLVASGLTVSIHPSSVYAIIIIAILGATLFTFPIIWAAGKIKTITLIRQDIDPRHLLQMTLWSFIPMVGFFYILAIWMGDSVSLGTAFSLLFVGTILVVFVLGFLFWKSFSVFKNSRSLLVSFIARSLYRNRSKSFFYFFAIALSVALISLTPQLQYSINNEIQSPDGLTIPSLFVFEIRKDDIDPMDNVIKKYNAVLTPPIPFISAKIKNVNGEPFSGVNMGMNNNDDDRGDDTDNTSKRNQVNLSYRSASNNQGLVAESIVAGRPLQSTFNTSNPLNPSEIAELSIEQRFANQNNLSIGDRITFSLINVPFTFTGEIVNLRKVRWNTFQPNFFIMVQDQVLNEVPQKYVASIEQVANDIKVVMMSRLNQLFPNLSILDVQEIIQEILNIIDKFSLLLRLMAGFCLALGLLILFSIINQEIKNQAHEINLMKAIGGKFTTLYMLVLGEYTLIGFLAILSGIIPSIAVNYVLGIYFYDGSFVFSPLILLQIFLVIMPLIIIINYLAARKILLEKPILLLKSN